MSRLILFAVLFLLIAIVSSSSVSRNDDRHKKPNGDNSALVIREKRNMHSHPAHKRAHLFSTNLAARKKRNKQLDDHALRAEADSLAAAAESVAAGDNAANAAIEIEEERQSMDHGQSGSKDEDDSDQEQSGNKEEHDSGQGQGGSKDEHEESDVSNEENVHDTEEGSSEIVEEETIHEKTKTSHKHASSAEDDSQSEGLSSVDSDENSETSKTSMSKSNGNGAALNTLMSQSSELAQQIRMVFDIMSKREKYLVDEMKQLQNSLAEAIKVLKSSQGSTGGTVMRKRREFHSEEPYRACVYIESAVENIENDHGSHGHHRTKRNTGEKNPPSQENIKVQSETLVKDHGEHGYSHASQNLEEGHQKNTQVESSTKEGIDLSKVYWFKLPDEKNMEAVHEKVQKILTGIRATDRDVLIIPVTKSFTSKQEVTNAFFRVFRFRRQAKLK